MPSRSMVPAVTAARRGGRSPGRPPLSSAAVASGAAAGPGRPSPAGRPWRSRPRWRSPGVLRQGGRAGVVGAVGQVEAGRVFGDQGPLPGPLAAGGLASGGVEGQRGGAEVPGRPGPLGLGQPHQVQEVVRRVRGPFSQPASVLVQFGQQPGALVTVGCAGLLGQGQPAQRPGHGHPVLTRGGRQQRHRRRGVPGQAAKSPKMAAATARLESAWRSASGLPAYRSAGAASAAAGRRLAARRPPPVAVEPLADLLVPGHARNSSPASTSATKPSSAGAQSSPQYAVTS